MKPKILIADPLAEPGPSILREVGEVVEKFKMGRDELLEAVKDVDAVIVRSETYVTAEVIEAAPKLKVIARAGAGVDNIDCDAATRRGVLVVNSPSGNTLAAAEHTIALLLATARNIPQAYAEMCTGKFDRRKFIGRQVLGKTLGVVGYGRIGREVALRAKAFGMRILACDPYVADERIEEDGVKPAALEELLHESDFVSLHVALREETKGMMGEAQFRMMKPTAIFINVARGKLVDEAALIRALQEKWIAGAALDVFADDKNPSPELLAMPNVVTTPHLGASTAEAQEQVARDAAEQVVAVLQGRAARWAVNAPVLPPEAEEAVGPYLDLAQCLGAFAAGLATKLASRITVAAGPQLTDEQIGLIARCGVAEYLRRLSGQVVTYVNAMLAARERGVQVAIVQADGLEGYQRWATLVLESEDSLTRIGGAVLGDGLPRLVRLDDFVVDFVLRGRVLIIWHGQPGKPGFIGKVGTILGNAGISITGIEVGLEPVNGVGLMLVSVEHPIPQEVLAEVSGLEGVQQALVTDVG
ncbi:MAG: phosphoglycerate dehydrogenase [Armatimonadetes bacterium]|nr:phosphoglycerate dehydrogenase [Armatimonadota bacterium]